MTVEEFREYLNSGKRVVAEDVDSNTVVAGVLARKVKDIPLEDNV